MVHSIKEKDGNIVVIQGPEDLNKFGYCLIVVGVVVGLTPLIPTTENIVFHSIFFALCLIIFGIYCIRRIDTIEIDPSRKAITKVKQGLGPKVTVIIPFEEVDSLKLRVFHHKYTSFVLELHTKSGDVYSVLSDKNENAVSESASKIASLNDFPLAIDSKQKIPGIESD